MSGNTTDVCVENSQRFPVVVIEAVLVLGVSIATVVFNSSLLYLLLQKNVPTTPEAVIFGSMAVSDLLVGICSPFILFYRNEIFRNKIVFFITFSNIACSASVLHLLLVSVEKYIVLFFPLHYQRLITKRNVAICLAAAWVFSTFSSIAVGTAFTSCTRLELLTRHAVIGTCIITLLVLAVMSYIYIAVFLLSRRHRRQIAASRLQQPTSTTMTTTTVEPPAAPTLRSLRAKMKTVFFSVIFCACVFLLWLPALVQVLYSSYTGVPADETVTVFLQELFFSNSLVNPILYGLWHHDVRREVKRRLRQLCCKRSSCTTATPNHTHTRW